MARGLAGRTREIIDQGREARFRIGIANQFQKAACRMQIFLTAPQECFGERRIGIHGAVEIGLGKGAKLAFGQCDDIMLGKRSK